MNMLCLKFFISFPISCSKFGFFFLPSYGLLKHFFRIPFWFTYNVLSVSLCIAFLVIAPGIIYTYFIIVYWVHFTSSSDNEKLYLSLHPLTLVYNCLNYMHYIHLKHIRQHYVCFNHQTKFRKVTQERSIYCIHPEFWLLCSFSLLDVLMFLLLLFSFFLENFP